MWVGVKGSFDVFGYLRGPHEEFEKVVLMFWGHVNFTTRRRATTAEMKKRKNFAFSSKVHYDALRLLGLALIKEKSSTTQFHHIMIRHAVMTSWSVPPQLSN